MIALDDWRARGRSYFHRGHPVFYVEEGEGPALLLVHGFPTASWDWSRVWAGLAARFRVIAPDLIGFGFSAKPRSYEYSLADQADLCAGLLAERGIRETDVLAHDYGDTVAQELLARSNEGRGSLALRSVCFLNGGLFPETHRPRLVQKMLIGPIGPLVGRLMTRSSFERSFRSVFGPRTQPTGDELDAFWRLVCEGGGLRVMHRLIRYMAERRTHRERWVGALQRARVPLRVVDGALDPVSGAHMVARYRELVPDADVVLLPDVGHYPQTEAPEAVLAAFLAFVDTRRP
ncbi:MAG TPA: alpha/beta hydrolase [Vicinamibacteria bacterium]|nr:alpha/beta hydrolase [Vicinamibacteria bacterium]